MVLKLAETIRANAIETLHYGSYAYLINGEFGYSNLDFLKQNVCLRSSVKPFQTLSCLRLDLELNEKEIAICSGSHSGSSKHTDLST
ncbi:MAG: asparaginase [Candidatus Caenarcaniphilales bacterium]|nr:asparaginase [Candidatus Caenarcaniphilales bacterium]